MHTDQDNTGLLLVAGTLIGSADCSLLCEAMGHPDDASTLRQRSPLRNLGFAHFSQKLTRGEAEGMEDTTRVLQHGSDRAVRVGWNSGAHSTESRSA